MLHDHVAKLGGIKAGPCGPYVWDGLGGQEGEFAVGGEAVSCS